MKWVYDDGGRSKYFAGATGDCVTRAIAIATGIDYKEVYDEINRRGKLETKTQLKHHRGGKRSTARSGVYKETWKQYLADLGWEKHSTCGFGKGVQCHLVEDELPSGTIIVQVARHLVCVKDGVLHDTWNSSEKEYIDCEGNECTNDRRAVYGYWTAPEAPEDEAPVLPAISVKTLMPKVTRNVPIVLVDAETSEIVYETPCYDGTWPVRKEYLNATVDSVNVREDELYVWIRKEVMA